MAWRILLSFVAAAAAAKDDPLLSLTDSTLQAALDEHRLMLISIGVEGC